MTMSIYRQDVCSNKTIVSRKKWTFLIIFLNFPDFDELRSASFQWFFWFWSSKSRWRARRPFRFHYIEDSQNIVLVCASFIFENHQILKISVSVSLSWLQNSHDASLTFSWWIFLGEGGLKLHVVLASGGYSDRGHEGFLTHHFVCVSNFSSQYTFETCELSYPRPCRLLDISYNFAYCVFVCNTLLFCVALYF